MIPVETLQAFREGDHQAFEKIFTSYFNKTKVFITSYIKSEVDAEEIAEDLFVNLWLKRKSIDTARSFDAYMHTIARNAALNFLKHKYIRDTYLNRSFEEEAHTPEDELIAKELSLLIDRATENLPKQCREIYLLSRKEGLNNEEIALRLQTTKRNVESQLSQALKLLRKSILTLLLFTPL